MSTKEWLIDNRTKVKRRYWEPITILWVVGFGVSSILLFFIPFTQHLWLWTVTAFLTIFGGLIPFKDGPGFLVAWDRYQHLTRNKKPLAVKEDGVASDESQGVEGAETDREDVSADGKEKKPRKRRVPINARTMEFYDSVNDIPTGTLYLPPRIADASMIVADGFEWALADSDEFYDKIDNVSESVLEAARASMYPVGITQGFVKRPLDITRSRAWQERNVHKKILASVPGSTWQEVRNGKPQTAILEDSQKEPKRPLSAGEVLHQDMIERDTLKQKRASDAYHFYSILVPRPEEWPLGNNGDLSYLLNSQQIDDAPILRLTKLAEEGLVANGLLGVQRLDLDGLHNHLRKAWDMGPSMQLWNQGAEVSGDGKPFDLSWPWPPGDFLTGLDPKRLPYIQYGQTIHRLYQLAGLEHKVVRPRQFQLVFQPGYLGPTDQVGFGMVTTGETVLSSEESRATTRMIRARKAFRRLRGADGGDRDESQLDREEAMLLENERDAFDHGGSHGLYFNQYFALSVYAKTEKERFRLMRHADENFRLVARTSRVVVRPIRLAPHMNRVFWTMFGGAGMM